MTELDAEEKALLGAFEDGELESVATKDALAIFKAAAQATAIDDRRDGAHPLKYSTPNH